jgi:hypothetical protein
MPNALPVWVKPLTTTYKPLDDRPLETRIKALAGRCGVANIPVLAKRGYRHAIDEFVVTVCGAQPHRADWIRHLE